MDDERDDDRYEYECMRELWGLGDAVSCKQTENRIPIFVAMVKQCRKVEILEFCRQERRVLELDKRG